MFKKNNFWWSIAYLLLTVVYLSKDSYSGYVLPSYFIAFPVFFASFILLSNKGLKEYLIILALIFSGAGDLSGVAGSLILQMCFFAVAHILYIITFLKKARFSIVGIVISILIIGFVLFYIIFITIKVPGNELYAPIAYSIVISVMCVSSFLYNWQYRTLFRTGAVLFIISDGMIAWRMYMDSFPYMSLAIMASYYLAQYFFVNGALRRDNQSSKTLITV
ncbi:MAG: lysoplasmalogenase [Bacteroidetes bacterium]|nr:lysoplasmalogenase [Bacteroidota bacterium]